MRSIFWFVFFSITFILTLQTERTSEEKKLKISDGPFYVQRSCLAIFNYFETEIIDQKM